MTPERIAKEIASAKALHGEIAVTLWISENAYLPIMENVAVEVEEGVLSGHFSGEPKRRAVIECSKVIIVQTEPLHGDLGTFRQMRSRKS